MGNPELDGFTFKKAGKRMTAAELSAEVLKNLKGSAAARFGGEQLSAAVITVPAHFLIPACEDTKLRPSSPVSKCVRSYKSRSPRRWRMGTRQRACRETSSSLTWGEAPLTPAFCPLAMEAHRDWA
jgi:hypothetical protein